MAVRQRTDELWPTEGKLSDLKPRTVEPPQYVEPIYLVYDGHLVVAMTYRLWDARVRARLDVPGAEIYEATVDRDGKLHEVRVR